MPCLGNHFTWQATADSALYSVGQLSRASAPRGRKDHDRQRDSRATGHSGTTVGAHLAVGRDNVHPFPRGLQSKLPGRSVDWRTPPPPGLNALASYRPSARCRSGSAGPSVGSETMGFIVDGIRRGRTPVRTEILKPVTNQVTTPPGSARRSATRSDTVLLRSAVIRPNPTPSDGIGMHGKEKVYGSIP
jgi:hypothetical protein